MNSNSAQAADGGGLSSRIGYLASAGLVEYALQIVLPVVLVRYLDTAAFADYRLLWLMAATGLAIAPFFMPQSLYTLVPGSTPEKRSIRIGNTSIFLACAGLVTAGFLSPVNPLLPDSIRGLEQYSPAGSIFLVLWIIGSLMDVLPTVDGRARWQAVAVVGIAVFRTVLLACAAVWTGDVALVIWGMCVVGLTKIVVTWHYATQWKPALGLDWKLFVGQLTYALPFAIANALFLLRLQADQWVVASLYSPEDFAVFSIAAVVIPLSNLVRQPINNSLLPQIAEFLNREDLASAENVITRGYLVTGAVLLPFLGLIYVSASELVELIYTEKYRGAAVIMQVYLIGQVAAVFASGHLLPVLRCGQISALISGICLVATVIIGIAGAIVFGLVGAAVGSTFTLFIGEVWALYVVARSLGVPVSRLLGMDTFVRALLAVGVAVLSGWAIRQYLLLELEVLVRIVLQSAAFSAVWLVAIRLLGIADVFRGMIYRKERGRP